MTAHAYTPAEVEHIAKRLGGAGGACRCPAHDDRTASLSLSLGDDGRLLWHCHAGCSQAAVLDGLRAAGVLSNGDARPAEPRPKARRRGRIVASYTYVDEAGVLLFEVVRFEPKDFRQRRPDGKGGWVWKLNGTRRVLYRLPEVRGAEEVILAEGEKDVDNLRKAGFVATTNPGGAGNDKREGRKWLPAYDDTLAGKRIVILPDDDEKGRTHAAAVARSLRGKAASVKVVELPDLPAKGDVSDWLKAGHTADELRDLIARAPEWEPAQREEPDDDEQAEAAIRAQEAGEVGDALLDLSHDGLALALGEEWADQGRHVALWGRWLFWTGAKWEMDERLLHMTRTRDYLRRRADGLVKAADAGEVEGLDVDKAEAIAKTLRSAQTVAHVVGLARSNPGQAATTAMWDADPWALGTPGGIVDLRTGKLRPPDPLAYLTKSTAVAPAPPGTAAPKWQAFLERIFRHDPELIPFMQRVLGYALTGLTTEHALIFAWGQGGNGKGVLLNTVSRVVLDYAAIAPADLLLVTQSDRHPCDMAMLRGSRFVTAQELAPGRAWDEPKLKSLTGGDPITARFIRQDFFTFEPGFTLVVAGNHKPSFKGVDEAIRRRVMLVPFLQNIPEAERDKELAEKLKAEWPAILRWMVDGCLAWQKQGLNPPASVRAASEDYLAAEDVLGQWLDERCVASARIEFTASAVLYADWRAWCDQGGLPAGSSKTFSQRLSERGFGRGRDNKNKGFTGVGLRVRPEHEAGAGCAGYSDIGRKAGAPAHTHTHTPHMDEPGTSGTDADDEPDEVEL